MHLSSAFRHVANVPVHVSRHLLSIRAPFPDTADDALNGAGGGRFSPITKTDHAGDLWIVTILACIYIAMSCMARAYIKWGMFGRDDALLAGATVAHLGQAIAVFFGLTLGGLGKWDASTPGSQWGVSGRSFLSSKALAFLALCFSKCSICTMVLRVLGTSGISFRTRGWYVGAGMLGVSALWGLGSILAVTVGCDASAMLRTDLSEIQCPGQTNRWIVITSFDIVTDLVICVLPGFAFWPLAMSRKLKLQVFLMFGFRVLVVPLSLLHLWAVERLQGTVTGAARSSFAADHDVEPQFTATHCLLFQQAMLAASLISATIPNLKSFLRSFNTGMVLPGNKGGTDAESRAEAYPLRTIGQIPTRGNMHMHSTSSARDHDGTDDDAADVDATSQVSIIRKDGT